MHYGISASDASHAHENFENENHGNIDNEKGFYSPAGSDMSLSSDGSEPDDDEDIHDKACANANDLSVGSIPDDSVVSVSSLDIQRVMRSYVHGPLKTGVARVNGCVSVVPFSKHYQHEINSSISFCKEVETFQFEMEENNNVIKSTRD